jgi:hypothetical protein
MEYLSSGFCHLGTERVDKESRTLRGMVVAMEGDFVDGRGSFNERGLREIVKMINGTPKGLKSRFGHPSLLGDGLGRFLGRQSSARMGTAINREGKRVNAARADLTLDPSSFSTPHGNLGGYLLDLAESDSDALSSSLVIWPDEEERGRGLAPYWYPKELKASDIVEEGSAVAGLLDNADVLKGKLFEVLNRAFGESDREEVEEILRGYVSSRFGAPEALPEMPELAARLHRMQEMEVAMRSLSAPQKSAHVWLLSGKG